MHILGLSALRQEQFSTSLREMSGYETKTTFYGDFTIADYYGDDAVKDTFNRAFQSWKEDYEYITELYVVLNWKIFEHYDKNNLLAELYDSLWRRLGTWVDKNFTKDELSYFYQTID